MEVRDTVEIYNNEARAGTFLIAQGFKKEHRLVLELIKKYRSDFEDLARLNRRKSRPQKRKGPPVKEFLLTEEQTAFLGTLFRNNSQVVKFKKKLVREFFKMRRALEGVRAQQKDPVWLETREKGKPLRLDSTDTMKEFKTYAVEQGSQNADWYYVSLTKMLNGLLFIVDGKFKNLRNMMTSRQLMTIADGDMVIEKALADGMKKKTHYKDIYKLAKERVELFAELHGQSEILSQQLAIDW